MIKQLVLEQRVELVIRKRSNEVLIMTHPRILTILGARPQFIKAAPLSKSLRLGGWEEKIVHTGQHYDHMMSDVFFEELGLDQPTFHLNIAGGGHGDMVGRMLMALEPLLIEENPDIVLVYGDTNSTLAGALAAAQLNIPVAHVEAGLRSFKRSMPEEKNRRVTDHLSTLLYCPTQAAVSQLHSEGIHEGVTWVGDLMYDLALQVEPDHDILSYFALQKSQFSLLTLHRAETCDDPLIMSERLSWLADQSERHPIVWPIHPRARQALDRLPSIDLKKIKLIEPVGYRQMATFIKNAYEVFTDSGGVQREAFFHQTPCTTLRNESEWPETISAGWNRLWQDRACSLPPQTERSLPLHFGSGDAAQLIEASLSRFARDVLHLTW